MNNRMPFVVRKSKVEEFKKQKLDKNKWEEIVEAAQALAENNFHCKLEDLEKQLTKKL